MKRTIITAFASIVFCGLPCTSCDKAAGSDNPGNGNPQTGIITYEDPATQNILRAIQITYKSIDS